MLNQPLGKFVLLSMMIALVYVIVVRLLDVFIDHEKMFFIRKILKYVLGVVFVVAGFLIYRTHKKKK